jgi:DNA-binding MarR family transcriptional regulator
MTDALVREGLLARREDPSDRRAVLLEATPPGLDRAERWRGACEQAAADLFQPLSAGQRAELLQLLQALGL